MACIRNVVIWGNHSATQFAMADHATVEDGSSVEAAAALLGATGARWMKEELVPRVQQRGKAVIDARGASSAASAASAICDHIRDWWLGSAGRVVSMGVASEGNPYGVADGLIFSFPVVTQAGGKWRFADGFSLDDHATSCIAKSQAELQDERASASPA